MRKSQGEDEEIPGRGGRGGVEKRKGEKYMKKGYAHINFRYVRRRRRYRHAVVLVRHAGVYSLTNHAPERGASKYIATNFARIQASLLNQMGAQCHGMRGTTHSSPRQLFWERGECWK